MSVLVKEERGSKQKRGTGREEGHLRSEADTDIKQLQAKECLEWPVAGRGEEGST